MCRFGHNPPLWSVLVFSIRKIKLKCNCVVLYPLIPCEKLCRIIVTSTGNRACYQTIPQCNCSLEFPAILSQNHINAIINWVCLSWISKIMHCGILINMPYWVYHLWNTQPTMAIPVLYKLRVPQWIYGRVLTKYTLNFQLPINSIRSILLPDYPALLVLFSTVV